MKTCNDCKITLEKYLCDVPSRWREQIINVICNYLENQEFPCSKIISCINDEMGTLDPKCLTNTQQEWEWLSYYDKIQLIINKLCEILDINQLSIEDTSSIQLLGNGTPSNPLQADLKLSSDLGQISGIEIRPDGLFIPSQSFTVDRGIKKSSSGPDNYRLSDVEDGPGTHFLWNYDKAAFRVGITTGTQWNNVSIAQGSVGFGKDTTLLGDYSFAAGDQNYIYSTADYSFVLGRQNEVEQPFSGTSGTANSVVGNNGSSLSEGSSFAFGIANKIYGGVSFAVGVGNIITNNYSASIGHGNKIDARWGYTIGKGLYNTDANGNKVENHIIVGNFNDITSPIDIDELESDSFKQKVCFTIAGGYEVSNSPNPNIEYRSDALKVYKSGNIKFFGAINQKDSTRGIIPAQWTTSNRPLSPELGEGGFNLTLGSREYWDGSIWKSY